MRSEMLFMFRTHLRRPNEMPAAEFYGIWLKEALASRDAVEAGVIKQIWKVPGVDQVIGVLEVADPDDLDRGLLELPIWKSGSTHLVQEIEWTALRPYENWTADLAHLAKGDTPYASSTSQGDASA